MSEEKNQQEASNKASEKASHLLDDMIRGLKDFGTAALEKAEEFGKVASEKAEELTRIGKIKLDIHQLKRSQTKNYADLGALVYNLNVENKLGELSDHENFTALCKSIEDLAGEIAAKEAEAEEAAKDEASEDVIEVKEEKS